MKKIIVMMIIIGLLTGCSQGGNKPKADRLYILFATPLKEHPIWLQAKKGFDDACEELNIHHDWIGPVSIDTKEMEKVIATGILQKADAIITQGVVDKKLINDAYEANIPMILVDSDIEDSERLAYIGKDFTRQAKIFLHHIEQQYGKDRYLKIGMQVAEDDFTIAKAQIEEISKIFATHPGGFEIVNVSESQSDQVRAKKEWNMVLDEYEINVAINFAGESVIACSESVIEKGLRNDILIYGVDDIPSTIELIKEGNIDGSVVTSFYNYGYQSVQILYNKINGDKTKDKYEAKMLLVDQKNVGEYKKLLK